MPKSLPSPSGLCHPPVPAPSNVDIIDVQSNLGLYSRIHFMRSCCLPIILAEKAYSVQLLVAEITCFGLEQLSKFVKCDICCSKYMACCMYFQGDAVPNVNAAELTIKTKRAIQFVEKCSMGCKCGHNYQGEPSSMFVKCCSFYGKCMDAQGGE